MSTSVVFPQMPASAGGSQRRRPRLHELENGFHCSIVGTCLSPGIARQIVRRAKLEFEPDTQDYRLHSVLVSEAARPGIVSRLITKALDESFAGTVRRVGATVGTTELAALWEQLCDKGGIAGAYWAFLTHSHVPAEMRVRLFGEIHMLSHFMGGHNRAHSKALWLAERRAEQLAERLARSRRQAQNTQAERDRRITDLEAELARTRTELAHRVAGALSQRRVTHSRAVDTGRLERRALAGGQCAVLPHLRRHAQTRCLELLHHDGGEENNLHALEGLVGRADAVFCPIDCVSHQACLAAKQLCRRLDKPFVPLRTSSGTCFLRAIDRWRVTARGDEPAPGL